MLLRMTTSINLEGYCWNQDNKTWYSIDTSMERHITARGMKHHPFISNSQRRWRQHRHESLCVSSWCHRCWNFKSKSVVYRNWWEVTMLDRLNILWNFWKQLWLQEAAYQASSKMVSFELIIFIINQITLHTFCLKSGDMKSRWDWNQQRPVHS